MSFQPGSRLGPYEIERLLGEGGMGVVYKARDVRLKRDVAINPEILFYRFNDQTTNTVLRLPRPVGLGLSLAPDESWLLFSQLDGSAADLMLIDGFSAGR